MQFLRREARDEGAAVALAVDGLGEVGDAARNDLGLRRNAALAGKGKQGNCADYGRGRHDKLLIRLDLRDLLIVYIRA